MNFYKIIFTLLCFVSSANAENGERLAYLQYDGDYWQVYVNDENGLTKKITKSHYDKTAISWFAGGYKLFVCGIQAEAEIIDVETKVSEKIFLPKATVNDAVMSPDGKKILYSYIDMDTTDNKLWLYDLRTNENKPILANLQGRQYDPKWNVAGNAFYFITGFADKSYSIAKSFLNSKIAEIVIHNTRLNLDIDVSKNEDVAWSSNMKNSFNIWVKLGKEVRQLTNTEETDMHPNWSKNSDSIYFSRVEKGVSNIWKLSVNGDASAQKITHSETGARYPIVFKGRVN